jgi:deoxyribodipyrimidine photo-lyase
MAPEGSRNPATSIVWFRNDLRLTDHPALQAAVQRGGPVLPVFIWAPEEEESWPNGGASNWWLHRSLRALDCEMHELGSQLLLRTGPSLAALLALISQTGASAVFWNRRYEPAIRTRDLKVQQALQSAGIEVQTFNAALLHEPASIANKAGKPFQVFTPYWRHCLTRPEPRVPLKRPGRLAVPGKWPGSEPLETLKLEPVIDWAGGLRAAWMPGERGAKANLDRFLADAFLNYPEGRNRPDLPGSSRLSPHLHFGEISPQQIWDALKKKAEKSGSGNAAWQQSQFVAELGWREFSHHLLYHFPHTDRQPLREEFRHFPWRQNKAWLKAWQCGRTGYPFVDAGMRELWTTGWMHNRVRMVTASFLVKDLLIPWQEGARWFWDTLVDADLAQNTLGWQWTAGCGADAAPFFRIFNPITQGEKFDPEGNYVRRWIPELARLPDQWIHKPHLAPPEVLNRAEVRLDENYPRSIVKHTIAREVALEAYAKLR